MNKPFAPSCEKNKDPILSVLNQEFDRPGKVLEVGSGTGQHAIYFARHLPHIQWQPSDRVENLSGIQAWYEAENLPNVAPPKQLDVNQSNWNQQPVDYIFAANAVHIMSWDAVENFFAGIGRILDPAGKLVLYGPFNYNGRYTSESNAQFDVWLKQRDPLSGIRNFEDLDRLAAAAGLKLHKDYPMPANNRTLVWAGS